MQEDPGYTDVDSSCNQCVKWKMMCRSKLCSFDVPRNYLTKKEEVNLKLNPEHVTH